MTLVLLKFWKQILLIGHSNALNQKQQMRLHTLNAFAFASILLVIGFVIIFVSIDSNSAMEGLPIAVVMAIVLWLNSRQRYETAKLTMVFLLTIIVLAMALSDRRTGTEYILIAVACASILVFEDVYKILLG